MSITDDVKPCPACGAPNADCKLEGSGVKTFRCTDCENDWEERDEQDEPPDTPGV